LKRFYRKISKYLQFEPLWFDGRIRSVIARSFEATAQEFGYTVWACAICWNHSHLVTRIHRDSGQAIWDTFTGRSRMALIAQGLAPEDHPIWSDRCYTIYKTDVPAVWSAVALR
jgi:REP element-mobilizing transposase RayT